ncbi:MAG: hypothetical protein HY735_03530 [Verrucomicrobia bacterium]|nr:hypothetical protein [Verrucomicrobiota bacterium]
MKRWKNLTIKHRYQLAFAAAMALLILMMLGLVWIHDKKLIPSLNAPLFLWLGQEPPPPSPQPVAVAAAERRQEPPLAEFVADNAPQAPPPTPSAFPVKTNVLELKPEKLSLPPVKDSVTNAIVAKEVKPPVEEIESRPADSRKAFPIRDHHFEQAQAWMLERKGPPLLLASYVPGEILTLARKERGFIVAEGELNGQVEKMIVLLQQETNPRLIKLDSRTARNISASALNLRPNGTFAALSEAVELCFAGRPAKLFFHPTADVGSSIIRKQFAAIAAAGISDPETVTVTDGDLLIHDQSVVYVVNRILLRGSQFIYISDPAEKQPEASGNSYR